MKVIDAPVQVLTLTQPTIPLDQLGRIKDVRHSDPHSILGAHTETIVDQKAIVIRVNDPFVKEVSCILEGSGQAFALTSMGNGYFEGAFVDKSKKGSLPLPLAYHLRYSDYEGHSWESEDPYAFPPTLGDLDLHLFNEGNHYKIYEHMGAHPRIHEGVQGTSFAVWAPNADRVSVVGAFNNWDGRRLPMRLMGNSGVWELFVPRLPEGTLYKFEVRTRGGDLLEKTDPYGFAFEMRPSTAGIVTSIEGYEWNDAAWMEARKSARATEKPMNVYEVHLGSWMQDPARAHKFLTYIELGEKLAAYAKDMGYTHVELLPIMEHPLDMSWGYQVSGYYAPTSRFGSPKEFMRFVEILHQHGIGVIVDWVPAHFPKDAWSLGRFDGTALFEHEDPRKGEHRDWGTYIFNFGRHEVKNFLTGNALFWLDKYHIDGLRVDAVASMIYLDYSRKQGEWIPNQYGGRENLEALDFIKHANSAVHEYFPGAITVAEESTSWPMVSRPTYVGGLGFDFKWNMGWMHDFLEYVAKEPIHRKYHHHMLTFAMIYAYSENFVLVLSHDEVVHGKRSLLNRMPGDDWQRFANLRVAMAYMMGHPGKKLNFMGTEIGQWSEWWEAESVHWGLLDIPGFEYHRRLHNFVRELNHLYLTHPAFYEVDYSWKGFDWIDCNDSGQSVISFIRRGSDPNDYLIFIFNFTPVARHSYRIGVPRDGFYRELLNSDGEAWHGSNVGNAGGVWAHPVESHGQAQSLSLIVPPLGALILQPEPSTWSPLPSPAEG